MKAVESVSRVKNIAQQHQYGGIQQQEIEFRMAVHDLIDVNFKGLRDCQGYLVIAGDVFDIGNVPF